MKLINILKDLKVYEIKMPFGISGCYSEEKDIIFVKKSKIKVWACLTILHESIHKLRRRNIQSINDSYSLKYKVLLELREEFIAVLGEIFLYLFYRKRLVNILNNPKTIYSDLTIEEYCNQNNIKCINCLKSK